MADQLEEDTEEVKETNDTEFVIEKSPIQFEKKSEEPTTERISNETVQKLEQELSSAAAAMAQLQLEGQSKPTVSGETGQDLMSFEMLDMSPRGSNKMSQTATPNNTPLGMCHDQLNIFKSFMVTSNCYAFHKWYSVYT